MEDAELVKSTLTRQGKAIQDKQRKLLEAHYVGAIPLELLRSEQQSLAQQLAAVDERLLVSDVRFEGMRTSLTQALDLAEDCEAAYRDAPDHVRRWFNQAFFSRILVTEEDTNGQLTPAMHRLASSRPAVLGPKENTTFRGA